MDTDAALVAPCGMNCGICSAYLARSHEVKTKGIPMPYCTGCRPRNKQCAFLKKHCDPLREGRVRYCHECPGFPCDRLKTLDERYRERYRMSMLENLILIRDRGIDAFLESEDKKWRCPGCGGTICCHNGCCFDCGLDQLRAKKHLYRWEER